MSSLPKNIAIEPGPFQPTWESLRTYQVPDWFRDAKLGIWSHWGPQSVPMTGDWYARHMYWEGHPQYLYHLRHYGHPSKVGYKDIVQLWKAERFDPEALMDLYASAGARYFVAQAVHHDNFDNWDSKHQPWNATRIGPKKNIVGLWENAARKRGLKFGLSEHLGASFSWFNTNKLSDKSGPHAGVPYDGNDPAFADLYHSHHGGAGIDPASHWSILPWYNLDPSWHEMWFNRIKDLLDQHEPDLLYSDGGVPFDTVGLSIVAHLYNLSVRNHGKNLAVYNQKDSKPEVYSIGVLDIERGNANEAASHAWQNDTCVGGWYYDAKLPYKSPKHVIEIFVDCVSKNGNLLLNIIQRPDGSLDEECEHIVRCLGAWMRVNGEGIHSTRPWKQALEGPTRIVSGHFKEDAVPWTSADFRFTAKGDVVYAFQMRYADSNEAFIRSLGLSSGRKVKAVAVLGSGVPTAWHQYDEGLLIAYPAIRPVDYLPCLKVTLA